MKVLFKLFFFVFTYLLIDFNSFAISYENDWNHSWIKKNRFKNINKSQSIKNLINLLETTITGRKIVRAAQKKYKKNISSLIKVGDVSITDTSLLRSFYPNSTRISYEEKSMIKINKNLNLKDAILDLSHELTHYTYRIFFNPYEKNYSTQSYVQRTIEGQGGEVDAFVVECKVRQELFGKKSLSENQCASIVMNGRLTRTKAVALFYQMGKYYSKFIQLTDLENSTYQFANSKNLRFISSAYSIPYPLAAVMEFHNIKRKICSTNKKRIKSFQKELRKPASLANTRRSPASSVVMTLKDQYKKRCL